MFETKFPCILQTEAAECGLTCLAMVANYHGNEVSLFELRERYSVGLKGLTLKDLMFIADSLQFNTRAIQVELQELENLTLPTIIHWNFDHFVVLKEVRNNKFFVNDPALGECQYSFAQMSRHFTGVALELHPKNSFLRTEPAPSIGLKDLFYSIRSFSKSVMTIIALSFILQIFVLLLPFFSQIGIDNIVTSEDGDFLFVLGFGFVFISIFNALSWFTRSYQILQLRTRLDLSVMTSIFRHLLGLPHDYFAKRHMGDIQSRFKSFEVISETLTQDWIESIVDGVFLILIIIIMAIYSPILAAISVLTVSIYYTTRKVTLNAYISRTNEAIVCKAREDTLFLESLRGIVPLKNFSQESKRMSVWSNAFVKSLNSGINVQKMKIGYSTTFQLLSGIEFVLIVWLGIAMVLDGVLTVGMLVALFAYQRRVSEHSQKLVDNWFEMKYLKVHLQRLSDILLSKPETNLEGKLSHNLSFQNFSVENLTYRYSALEEPVLTNISVAINKGEIVCIVGQSGCGKSTLLKLMVGLLQPESGQVKVDEVNINDMGLKKYRQQIAVLMQEDSLFNGTLKDNITMFDPNPDTEHLRVCCKAASIYNEIVAMPMSFATLVGDMGNSLSGGQKQRILLARALYKSPKILFLDEATSHLDPIRERKINRALKKLGITIVMVAHRQETVELADRVIDLNEELAKVAN